MSNISVTRLVDRDARAVWQILADFEGIAKFNPFLSHSALLGKHSGACGVGTHRQCDIKFGGSYMREKVVAWKEGESYTVHIYESRLPVNHLFTTIGVAATGESQSRVYMKSKYQPKFGIAGVFLDVIFLRFCLRFLFRGVLKGLEKYLVKQGKILKNENLTYEK